MRTGVAPLLFLLCFAFTVMAVVNNRPIIGIVTQPIDGMWTPDRNKQEYIAASYVKWVESGGAQVIPLIYTLPDSELNYLMSHINGILLPGGGADLDRSTPYYKSLEKIYKLALKFNDQGSYFPVWGTCQGFQELSILASNGADILSTYDSENYTIPLDFTAAANSSRLFRNAPANIIQILAKQPVTMNNHHYGVSPSTFEGNALLRNFFTVSSTNVDRDGKVFISTMEANHYPFYLVQWHPEKPLFEWNPLEVMDHSTDSIKANGYTNEFFITEARKSDHRFPTEKEAQARLIYHYEATYTFPHVDDFEQCYYF